MKKIYSILFLAFAAFVFMPSCQPQNDPDNQTGENYTIIREQTFSAGDLANLDMAIKAFTQIPMLSEYFADRKTEQGEIIRYRSYTYSYKSKAVDGTPVTLSGRVTWPVTEAGNLVPNRLVLGEHYTNTADVMVPSNLGSANTSFVLIGAAVIEADYQGYGISKNLRHNFMMGNSLAAQVVDCYDAGMQLMKDKGVEGIDALPRYNIGYSQGGQVALAVSRYIEQNNLTDRFGFTRTYCGAGPYCPALTYGEMLKVDSMGSAPYVLPMSVIGIYDGHSELQGKYRLEDFFTTRFVEQGLLDMVLSKKYNNTQLTSLMREKLGSIRNDYMLNADLMDTTSQMSKDLYQALHAEDLVYDWQPTMPISFLHDNEDDVVPYANQQEAQKYLSNNQTTFTVLQSGGSHSTGCAMFYIQLHTTAANW